jgi:hypothetical protein
MMKNNMEVSFATVEVAATNRASCKSCTKKIQKGELKVVYADTNPFFGHSSDKSLCKICGIIILQTLINKLKTEKYESDNSGKQGD